MPVRGVTCQLPPVAEAYCTLYAERSTVASDTFASSMKSRARAAPALPPPPYTSEITTGASAETAACAAGASATLAVAVASTVAIVSAARGRSERG